MPPDPKSDAVEAVAAVDRLLVRLEKAAAAVAATAKRARKNGDRWEADAAVSIVQTLIGQVEPFVTARNDLSALATDLEQLAERQFLELESRLHEECAARGWRLEGTWPILYVERAIQVEIDSAKRTATVGGRKIGPARCSSIGRALEHHVRDLIPSPFSASEFIKRISESYDEARAGSAQVPVFDVYRRFVVRSQAPRFWRDARAEDFKGTSAEQFRARLTRALEEGATMAPDGRELKLLPPLDPKDGLFLYQPAEARFGYVGRIEFVDTRSPTDL
jgi:hypothetical protein